jgi:hypothetical protein
MKKRSQEMDEKTKYAMRKLQKKRKKLKILISKNSEGLKEEKTV